MDYWIKGETYSIKEELKSLGCKWDKDKRLWKVLDTSPRDIIHKTIKDMGCELVPVELSDQCAKIQEILSGN